MHGFAIRLFLWSLKPRVPASCSMVVKQALPLVPGVRSRLSGLVTPSQMTQTWSLAFGHRVATMGLGFNDCFISIGSYPRPEIISFLTLSVASLFVKKAQSTAPGTLPNKAQTAKTVPFRMVPATQWAREFVPSPFRRPMQSEVEFIMAKQAQVNIYATMAVMNIRKQMERRVVVCFHKGNTNRPASRLKSGKAIPAYR